MAGTDWLFPETIPEALLALGDGGSCAVAGGTSVLDLLKLGVPMPRRLVDLTRLPLNGIEEVPGQGLRIGALTSNTVIARSALVQSAFPALSEAILLGASEQIRNAATLGGNLLQANRCPYFRMPDQPCNRRAPGSGCPAQDVATRSHAILGTSAACIATHPSDMAVALLTLDAVVHWQTERISGSLPIAGFYRLPEDKPEVQTHLPPGALITAVSVPYDEMSRDSSYLKLRGRASYEFASASVAAAISLQQGKVRRISVALGGIGTVPWRDPEAEAGMVGQPLSERVIDALADQLLAKAYLRTETAHKEDLARAALHRLLGKYAG